MKKKEFNRKMRQLFRKHEKLITLKNKPCKSCNGIYNRYKYPVITAKHTPLFWRYDLDRATNPFLMERMQINSAFNPGAIMIDGTFYLIARVEGADRKSFLAVAESPNGIDNFRFWDYPIIMPETENPDVNIYDMRIVQHEDGWIYGVFCTERKDPKAPPGDTCIALAQAGIARTRDLKTWERLPDLKTSSPQQRNVVLHPELFNGQYAFYTRPQDDFIQTGSGGGIGWGLAASIEKATLKDECLVDCKKYHTIKESKNGLGPAPIKTSEGWLQLAHSVRNTAAGLRYVLYAFMTSLEKPFEVIYEPGGYLMAPRGKERVGDVSNVLFSNGWILNENGEILIYYASSDTRIHVATTTLEKMLDYVKNTPKDPLRSFACVKQRMELIDKNLELINSKKFKFLRGK